MASETETKVLCKTPTKGKQGTRIPKWKYDAIRKAIRKVVPANKTGIAFKDLSPLVAKALSKSERDELGSITWHTVTVKLHLEVIGEIERIAGESPQRIRRVRK